jgi:transcriptional regulator with XRE-family HTH domain
MITPSQCRAARAILGWTVKELARRAHTSPSTVVRFETEAHTANATTIMALKHAFEAAGVRFTETGGIEPPKSA